MLNTVLIAQAVEAATEATATTLSTGGTAVMVISVGTVLCLISFCLFRVMTLPPVDQEGDEYDPPRSLSM